MKKENERKVYEWYLVVQGRGLFPVDMLRYDSAFPLEQTDSNLIMGEQRERRVALVRRGVNEGSGNAARWRSFGWEVVGAFRAPDINPAKELRDALMLPVRSPSNPTGEAVSDGRPLPAPSGICTYCGCDRSKCDPFTCREH